MVDAMTWREDCLHKLASAAESVGDKGAGGIVRELAFIVDDLGFEYCSYVFRLPVPVSEPLVVWASTYPESWLKHYFSHKYLDVDPILHRIARDASPLIWAHTRAESEPAFWEEARSFGIRHGWAVATRGKQLSMGMLSLARSTSAVTEQELSETEMKLIWLSHVVHGLVSAAELHKVTSDPVLELSHREREIMRWSAAGKTADEIGSILGIAERTVTFHIASVLTKLNVVNKTQAVAKALMMEMLN